MYGELGVGIHPKNVWVILTVSVTVFEGDLTFSHAAEASDSNAAAFAVFGVFERGSEHFEYILATYEVVVSCLGQAEDGFGGGPGLFTTSVIAGEKPDCQ